MNVKRIIAAVMAFSLVCEVLPTSGISVSDRSIIASAAEEIVDSGECGADGDNLTWTLDSKGTLTISGEGEMTDWDYVSDVPWYSYRFYDIINVVIEDSVTSIGDSAFSDCYSLTSITIPDSVTSIGDSAFFSCSNLTSIIIPDSVTSIRNDAFYRCYSLTSVTIPDSVTSIGRYAFSSCDSLTSITIKNPECEIVNSSQTISDTATIYGYEGSTAQAYAEKYDRKFEVISEASEIMYGDIDGDGKIAASDAALTLTEYANLASGKESFTEVQFNACDVNGDGKIAADDAANILSYYAYLAANGTEKDMKKWYERVIIN